MNERCEWNPVDHRPATELPSTGERGAGDCPNETWWSVGSGKTWHLCNDCAQAVEFKRFRRRVPINANPASKTSAKTNYNSKIYDGDYCGCCGREFSGHNFFCVDCLGHIDKSQQYPWEMTWFAQHKATCPFEAEKI